MTVECTFLSVGSVKNVYFMTVNSLYQSKPTKILITILRLAMHRQPVPRSMVFLAILLSLAFSDAIHQFVSFDVRRVAAVVCCWTEATCSVSVCPYGVISRSGRGDDSVWHCMGTAGPHRGEDLLPRSHGEFTKKNNATSFQSWFVSSVSVWWCLSTVLISYLAGSSSPLFRT